MNNLLHKKVICDSCKKEFKVTKPKVKKHRDGLRGLLSISYFSCKHCKKKYVTHIENDKLREMIRNRKSIYSSIRLLDVKTEDGKKEMERRFKEVEDLDLKIKSLSSTLKFDFAKYA